MSQYDKAFLWAMKQKGRPDPVGFQTRIDFEPGRALAVANYGLILMAEGEIPIPKEWGDIPRQDIKLSGIQQIEGTAEEAEYYAALWILLRRNEYLGPIRRLLSHPEPMIQRQVEELVTFMTGKASGFRDAWREFLSGVHN